jgi:hypothetical protein
MSSFFISQHMPCAECGASVRSGERERHTCDPERRLEYRIFQLRGEVATFDDGLSDFLDSPQGRFAQWLAERERRRRSDA